MSATATGRRPEIVDAHHHLWDLEDHRYPWLEEGDHDRGWGDWSPLRRNYLLDDLLADARGWNLVKSVHVQANWDPRDPVGETAWLQATADLRGFPHGIVAFADFTSPRVEETLDTHARHRNLRGVRQVLNRHHDPRLNRAPADYLGDEMWRANVGLLRRYALSFDAQVYYQQMPALAALARRHADIQFVLDHAGMPAERHEAGLTGWRRGMQGLSACSNVAVKLCGFGMVDLRWTVESIRPFILDAIEWFGVDRCMFASNFPVDKLMSSYDRLWGAYEVITATFSETERAALFCGTASRVYRL